MILSVIIPVYKSEETIHECVDSVLKNLPLDAEVILVDDGSPDHCPEICDAYAKQDERIRVVHKENGGLSSARNAGLRIAQGEYIFFLDSDDYLSENYFEKMFSHQDDLVVGNFTAFYSDGTKDFSIPFQSEEKISIQEYIAKFDMYFGTIFNFAWGKLYKHNLIGSLEFEEGISMCEDVLFNIEYYRRTKSISLENNAVVKYRQSSSSLSKSYSPKLFDWYLLSYSRLKAMLEDMGIYKDHEKSYIDRFMGNIGECLLEFCRGRKKTHKNKFMSICQNEQVVYALQHYDPQSFYMKGICSALKHGRLASYRMHMRFYGFLSKSKRILKCFWGRK